ncbi:MAG: cyclohexanecarboxylate-CoA ligase [Deltaproteobacteria bacterium]|nr:cyclohexanecarboxylate-CoA ligase [Deltaproteobacteria bacterium]
MLEARTFWSLVEKRAQETPNALIMVDETEREVTFAGLRDQAERIAAGLHAQGIGPGDAVSWVLPSRIDTVLLVCALARLSVVQNPCLPIYRERELGFVTKQTGARLLVHPGTFRGVDYAVMAEALQADHPGLEMLDLSAGLPDGDPATLPPAPAETTPEDAPVRWIFYTSGTTSDPKGARHTDLTLHAKSLGMANVLDLKDDDRIALVFPMAHIGGIGWLYSALMSGAGMIMIEIFAPDDTIPILARHGVTQATAGTVFHQAYLDAQRREPASPLFPRIRAFPGGAAPKPPQLHYDLVEEMGGVGIVSGYGLTECPIIAMNTTRCAPEKLAHTEGRVNPPDATMRVVTLEGEEAGPGIEGEIRAFGPQLFRGYVDESLNEAAFDDEGFFRTGDLGYLDEEGYVVITGRLKDVIIRKGENISAQEIEDLLYQHPKIADVAVIGLPDPASGERVCAVVQCAPGETLAFDEMVSFLLERELMKQKLPEQLELIGEIPRNPAGKILKKDLRDRYGEA